MRIIKKNESQFEVLPTGGYDSIHRFTSQEYPQREIILEFCENGNLKTREIHVNKMTGEIINLIEREKELITGELDLNDSYLMRYKRVIRENGLENEIREIVNKATGEIEQKS